ncbi:MAG: hypothetical protein ACWA5P_07100 [bacterium]
MKKGKLLISVALGLSLLFVALVFFKQYDWADLVRPMVLPWVLLYATLTFEKKNAFYYFLLFFTAGELIGLTFFVTDISTVINDLVYFGANSCFVIAYAFLIYYIFKLIDAKHLIEKLSLYIIILLALDIYCVVLVTNIAVESYQLFSIYDYILELSYNTIIMLLLTVALLNYISKDSKKAFLLFLGALCIVVSEITQVAYFYVSEIHYLQVLYSILLILAFVLFIRQYRLSHEAPSIFQPLEKVPAKGIAQQ